MKEPGNVFRWHGVEPFVQLALRRNLVARLFKRSLSEESQRPIALALATRLAEDIENGVEFRLTMSRTPSGQNAAPPITIKAYAEHKEVRGNSVVSRRGAELCSFTLSLAPPYSN